MGLKKYASSGDRDRVLARYREGPELLEKAIAAMGRTDLDALPATGGWTVRQIVHHVVDGDDLWKSCIKAALGDIQGEFTFDWYWAQPQMVWAERWDYAHRSLDVSLALLKAGRAHVLQLMEHVPDGWNRTIKIRKHDGGSEQLSVGGLVEMQADHLQHHVQRIVAMRQEGGGD